ncbi:hypothetical protein EC80569_0338 [Escherichia coli 8.0569]|nr:hypothetical protein EC80569_0338 [Escherichia coli 8.0569]
MQRTGGTGEAAMFSHGKKIIDMSREYSQPISKSNGTHHK